MVPFGCLQPPAVRLLRQQLPISPRFVYSCVVNSCRRRGSALSPSVLNRALIRSASGGRCLRCTPYPLGLRWQWHLRSQQLASLPACARLWHFVYTSCTTHRSNEILMPARFSCTVAIELYHRSLRLTPWACLGFCRGVCGRPRHCTGAEYSLYPGLLPTDRGMNTSHIPWHG
jgi:hypothetical protein